MLEALCVLLLTGCIAAAEPPADAPELEATTAQTRVASAAERPTEPARVPRDTERR